MATIYELKRRAQELSAKKDSLSISPDEVGGLIDETLDVINEAEKNQVGLGIRNTYTTVAKMNADSTSPAGSDGKPLKFGQIVTVYDDGNPDAADNTHPTKTSRPGQTAPTDARTQKNLSESGLEACLNDRQPFRICQKRRRRDGKEYG